MVNRCVAKTSDAILLKRHAVEHNTWQWNVMQRPRNKKTEQGTIESSTQRLLIFSLSVSLPLLFIIFDKWTLEHSRWNLCIFVGRRIPKRASNTQMTGNRWHRNHDGNKRGVQRKLFNIYLHIYWII